MQRCPEFSVLMGQQQEKSASRGSRLKGFCHSLNDIPGSWIGDAHSYAAITLNICATKASIDMMLPGICTATFKSLPGKTWLARERPSMVQFNRPCWLASSRHWGPLRPRLPQTAQQTSIVVLSSHPLCNHADRALSAGDHPHECVCCDYAHQRVIEATSPAGRVDVLQARHFSFWCVRRRRMFTITNCIDILRLWPGFAQWVEWGQAPTGGNIIPHPFLGPKVVSAIHSILVDYSTWGYDTSMSRPPGRSVRHDRRTLKLSARQSRAFCCEEHTIDVGVTARGST